MSEGRVRVNHRQRGIPPVPLLAVLSIVVASGLVVASSDVGRAADDASTGGTETPGVLVFTPSQQEGPFYPVELPADRDADLTLVDGADGPATGEPLSLEGLLVTTDGAPVDGAVVEIWQTDHQGVYLHPGDPGIARRDEAFQGYGESVTDVSGAWSFRTILPEIYSGRPRHIHAKVKVHGETLLTTQIYFSGGDIPQEGAVVLDGSDTDALVVEAIRASTENGSGVLAAEHVIVLP